ncbi:MAG: glycosyltransferase family 4 protein, partial [Candidatus Omnitrophica bacterium]|nr:glycosyltransferase family 4 protein [Candidatus Omnitrophota bacterium]
MKNYTKDTLKKIAIISPAYLPQEGGVAFYVDKLANGLCSSFNVDVITTAVSGKEEVKRNDNGLTVYYSITKWNFKGFVRLNSMINKNEYDFVNFQYAPNIYGKNGLNVSLPVFLLFWRMRNINISFFFHEIAIPFLMKHVKLTPFSIFNRIVFAVAVCTSKKIGISCQIWAEHWKKYFFWQKKKFIVVPVFSNFSYRQLTGPEKLDLKASLNMPKEALVLFFSGYLHPSKLTDFVLDALDYLTNKQYNVRLLYAGYESEKFRSIVEAAYRHLGEYIIITGICSKEQMEKYLNIADIYVCPYSDGVCYRRTSTMAGLQFGAATVTTYGENTEPFFVKENNNSMIVCRDKTEFIRSIEALAKDPGLRLKIGSAGKKLYEENFSKDKVVIYYTQALL